MEAETDSDSDEEEEEDKEKWSKTDPGLLGTKTPPFVKPVLSADDAAELDKLSTAYDYYKLFQSEKWVEEIVFQSKLYAVQENLAEPCGEIRFDGKNHWIVSTELDQKGQAKRRNCKQCTLEGKKDLKSVNMCEKCKMPLHVHCFKKYHVK